jgi:hypothetical protein
MSSLQAHRYISTPVLGTSLPCCLPGFEQVVLVSSAQYLSTLLRHQLSELYAQPAYSLARNATIPSDTPKAHTNDDSGSQSEAWDTSGHGLAADQAGLASTRLGRCTSSVRLVQHCSALGLRLYAWEWDQDIWRRGRQLDARLVLYSLECSARGYGYRVRASLFGWEEEEVDV